MTHRFNKILQILLMICSITGVAAIVSASDVPMITAEELRAMIGNPDLIIIDVRIERDWKSSSLKIKGAVWEDFMDVDTWAKKYPKDKTIVLYCD